ncbi:MAG: hypothetical protein V4699_00535 [Patescibacteria group bacterium]
MKEENLSKKFMLEKGKAEMHQVKMTATEKGDMLAKVLAVLSQPGNASGQPKKIISPFVFMGFARYASFLSLLLIFFGGITLASGHSLPGDILYPMKVKIIEPLQGAFKFSLEAEVAFQGSLATKRLIEAEELINKKKFDSQKQDELGELLKEHTGAFERGIAELDADESVNENVKDELVTDFEASLNAHSKILDLLHSEENLKSGNNEISENAKASAQREGDKLRNSKDKKPATYENRKDTVRSLIEETTESTNTDQNTEDRDEDVRDTIIKNTTKENLEKANESLREGDEEDQKGESKQAYIKLLDSESSAKEAQILLQLGKKFKR